MTFKLYINTNFHSNEFEINRYITKLVFSNSRLGRVEHKNFFSAQTVHQLGVFSGFLIVLMTNPQP